VQISAIIFFDCRFHSPRHDSVITPLSRAAFIRHFSLLRLRLMPFHAADIAIDVSCRAIPRQPAAAPLSPFIDCRFDTPRQLIRFRHASDFISGLLERHFRFSPGFADASIFAGLMLPLFIIYADFRLLILRFLRLIFRRRLRCLPPRRRRFFAMR
jgi:hypothetical protein